MRIISGRLKGRAIRPPRNLPVRPTTDMAKEGLFNIIANRFDLTEVRSLDLFCGTGNISLELYSRGVEDLTCVDGNAGCAQFVKQSLDTFGCERSNVVRTDAKQFLSRASGKWDIIFVDPPFDYTEHAVLVELIFHRQLLEEEGLLIMEHPASVDLSSIKGYGQTRKYGRVHFSLFGLEA
jgi:16S rRNA (guanine966-N2)-methyltransferase